MQILCEPLWAPDEIIFGFLYFVFFADSYRPAVGFDLKDVWCRSTHKQILNNKMQ